MILIDHMCGDFNRSYVWCRDCHSPWRRDVRAATSFDRFGGKLIRFFIFSNWSDSLFLTTQWQRACSALITRWFILVSFFFAPPLIHGRCFCCLRVRAAAVARASYNWVWFPRWSIHPSHYAGNKKFMFDNDQNHCDNDNEVIWFPIGNTDTDMLRLPLLIIIEITNYLVQQLTLEVEMNVSNSIHISFRVGHFSSCRHVQHKYTSFR